MKSNRITKEIKVHWNAVAALGCICDNQPAELAHCHAASITEELEPKFHPGMAERQSHWLVLPLCTEHHRGWHGLDTSDPVSWEARNGRQTELLEEVSYRLGYNVFEKAGIIDYEFKNAYYASTLGAKAITVQPESDDAVSLGEEGEIQ